ncbi:Hypothetical predicted protein [Octopus vulgaris]|uniref:Uncharacterized protein n=1 Tax=Octopus vulgaris TaxID=6645 RepID=A0AA36AKN8_OCTVU|nr:Hypothetical predicted protein [Octopus vulgaris]
MGETKVAKGEVMDNSLQEYDIVNCERIEISYYSNNGDRTGSITSCSGIQSNMAMCPSSAFLLVTFGVLISYCTIMLT